MMTATKSAVSIDDLRSLKTLIKSNWSLCDFMQKCEKEVMVASTIHACVTNYDQHGEIFSRKGNNLRTSTRLAQNAECYFELLEDGYLVEADWQGETVIQPTQKLIEKLKEFFKEKR